MKSSEGLSVQWSREDECIHTPKPHILQIDSVTGSHFGVYKCEVRKEGELKFTMYKHLFKKESHDQAMNMAAAADTSPLRIGGAIGIENIKRRCRVSDYQLDTEIPTKDLHILAGCFDNYEDFLDMLLLSPSECKDMKVKEYLSLQ
ncbi:uncharacterized protein LOC135346797 [Halichondria panicea]|uniref:uncharacterized protein LOC135346797 n=1 Tax=Halichondria panicea TaxID=6063 RepID=UPI00312B3540